MKRQILLKNVLFTFWLFVFIACKDQDDSKTVQQREIHQKNNKIFLTQKKINSDIDSMVSELSSYLDKSFGLAPIAYSNNIIEVRIAFADAFSERFLRQQFKNGILTSELSVCRMKREKDSLFMYVGDKIESRMNFSKHNLPDIKKLPNYKVLEIAGIKDKTGIDASNSYFIQLKDKNGLKTIFLNNPIENEDYDNEVKNISIYINNVYRTFNFTMLEPWDSSKVHAFLLSIKEE